MAFAGICRTALYRTVLRAALGLGIGACGFPPPAVDSVWRDGRYDTAFPGRDSPDELRALARAVCKVYVTVTYQERVFARDQGVVSDDLTADCLSGAVDRGTFTHSVSGTASVLFSNHSRVALLSCAHVLSHPDTIITFYEGDAGEPSSVVRSVSLAASRAVFVPSLPQGSTWRILLQDDERDIALLVREFTIPPHPPVKALACPMGHAAELEWGTFAYMLGYPRGVQTITCGLVSQPDRDGEGAFLTDAPFSVGSSGSVVLAIRDGAPNFELVGMAVSASGEVRQVLGPEERTQRYDEDAPYGGPVFVRQETTVDGGVTYVVPIEAVANLLEQHRETLRDAGFDIDARWPPDRPPARRLPGIRGPWPRH